MDFYTGHMTLRKLYVYVSRLPMGSALSSAVHGDTDYRHWSEDTHLLADIADIMKAQFRLSWVAGQLKGQPPNMAPTKRPGEEEFDPRPKTDTAAIDYLNQFAPDKGGSANGD